MSGACDAALRPRWSPASRRIRHKGGMTIHVGRLAAEAAAPREKMIRLSGHAVLADPSGALFWPDEHLLVVADLHLGKGSAYAARRVFLPPYDTAATLERLGAVIARLNPKRIVTLGDSFHDDGAPARLLPHDVQALRSLQTGRDWLWIAGNHDPSPPASLEGDHAVELAVGALRLRHEPQATIEGGEIAGHLHPVAIVGGRGGAVRRRCFVADGRRCILPAFGAYTGGLNVLDVAFRRLFAGDPPLAHVLGRAAVYSVATRQCLADAHGAERLWR